MLRLILTPEAVQDLDDVWEFVATNNVAAADNIIDEVTNRFGLLCETPEAGRSRSDLQAGLRSFPVGRYLIFYRINSNDVEIVRVLHGARDVNSLLS